MISAQLQVNVYESVSGPPGRDGLPARAALRLGQGVQAVALVARHLAPDRLHVVPDLQQPVTVHDAAAVKDGRWLEHVAVDALVVVSLKRAKRPA